MNNLEVAFQGDDHESKFLCRHANCRQGRSFKQHANCGVAKSFLSVIVAVGKRHDNSGHTKYSRKEIHGGLVGDECVDTAPKLMTCTDQYSKYHRVGTIATTQTTTPTAATTFGDTIWSAEGFQVVCNPTAELNVSAAVCILCRISIELSTVVQTSLSIMIQ